MMNKTSLKSGKASPCEVELRAKSDHVLLFSGYIKLEFRIWSCSEIKYVLLSTCFETFLFHL